MDQRSYTLHAWSETSVQGSSTLFMPSIDMEEELFFSFFSKGEDEM
jgi:hypothetical protein